MHHSLKESAGGKNHGAGAIQRVPAAQNTKNPAAGDTGTITSCPLEEQPFRQFLTQGQVGLIFNQPFHHGLVGLLVGLGPG